MSVQLSINKSSGGEAGKIDLSDAFGVDYNEPLIHQVVVAYQAAARSGTKGQKNRSAVKGGGAKPWRQKGTGRARAGTITSPIFRGGGRAFPASTRDYSQKVNRKMYRAAMRSILSELARQDRLVVVDSIAMDAPKTKEMTTLLSNLNADKALIVLAEDNANIELSARNLNSVEVINTGEVDPVSLLSYEKIIMTVDAAKIIDGVYK
ncbi:MAG: 50S ribosomal protein L4 [Acidiferrobacterales bacterium]|nr:50S ribosomal protein L4 [Acidiferrobacterales bacterium]